MQESSIITLSIFVGNENERPAFAALMRAFSRRKVNIQHLNRLSLGVPDLLLLLIRSGLRLVYTGR